MSDGKFKVGDTVKIVTPDPDYDGLVGYVVGRDDHGYFVSLQRFPGEPSIFFDHNQLRKMSPVEEMIAETDAVSPGHYKVGDVEVIDLTKHMGFLDGNVVKYVTRYKQKNGIEDLYKARKYLNWLIEQEESRDQNNAD